MISSRKIFCVEEIILIESLLMGIINGLKIFTNLDES